MLAILQLPCNLNIRYCLIKKACLAKGQASLKPKQSNVCGMSFKRFEACITSRVEQAGELGVACHVPMHML